MGTVKRTTQTGGYVHILGNGQQPINNPSLSAMVSSYLEYSDWNPSTSYEPYRADINTGVDTNKIVPIRTLSYLAKDELLHRSTGGNWANSTVFTNSYAVIKRLERVRGKVRYELKNFRGDIRQVISDVKYREEVNGVVEYTADVWQVEDSYPFGWSIKDRSFTHPNPDESYRYGFNGKENDKSFGNQLIQDYGFRLYNPAIAKFLSVDPLAPEYPELTPYQFASNTPIQAIDLDGLEAYFIHGTNSDATRWTMIGDLENKSGKPERSNFLTEELLSITNSKTVEADFDWSFSIGVKNPLLNIVNQGSTPLNATNNNTNDRRIAARRLVSRIVRDHSTTELDGSTTVNWGDDPITIIGHSHGGNVAIQAAKILYQEWGIKSDVITISTPTQPDGEGGFEDSARGEGHEGIRRHLHIFNWTDGVQGTAIGGDGDNGYKDNNKTISIEIDASKVTKNPMSAHSVDNKAPREFIRQLKSNENSDALTKLDK